jgi:hypothetical protein
MDHFANPVRFVIALIMTELASDVSIFDRIVRSDGKLIDGADTLRSLNIEEPEVISVIPIGDLMFLRVEFHH